MVRYNTSISLQVHAYSSLISGSGLASVLVARYQFMSTSIPFIISFSRPSKLTYSSQLLDSMVFFAPRMYGLFQTMFFFSYMGVGSVALGLLCGECA